MHIIGILITILGSIALFAGCMWVVCTHSLWFKKHRMHLLVAVALIMLTLYVVGYISDKSDPLHYIYSGMMGLFSTGRAFVLENDIGELGSYAQNAVYGALFSFACMVSMLIMAAVVLSFSGYMSICSLRVRFYKAFRWMEKQRVVIFSSANRETLMLADDIKAKSKITNKKVRIQFLIANREDETNHFYQQAIEQSYLLLHAEFDADRRETEEVDEGVDFSRIGLYPRRNGAPVDFIIADEELYSNIRIAARVDKKLSAIKEKDPQKYADIIANLRIFPIVGEDFDDEILAAMNCRELFHPVSRTDMAVDSLLKKHPIFEHFDGDNITADGRVTGTYKLLTVGAGRMAVPVWRAAVTGAQAPGLRPEIIAVGEGAWGLGVPFMRNNPMLADYANFRVYDEPAGTPAFFDRVEPLLRQLDCALVMGGSDERNMDVFRMLLDMQICAGKRFPIYVELSDSENYRDAFDGVNTDYFGDVQTVYTEDVVINDRLELQAQGVHMYYGSVSAENAARDVWKKGTGNAVAVKSTVDAFNQAFDTELNKWTQQSLFNRSSSKSCAQHMHTKLRLAHLAPDTPQLCEKWMQRLRDVPGLLSNLADAEHDRWSAFHAVRGWTPIPEAEYDGHNKIPAKRRHFAIVSNAKLLEYDERYPKLHNRERDVALVVGLGSFTDVKTQEDIMRLRQEKLEELLKDLTVSE